MVLATDDEVIEARHVPPEPAGAAGPGDIALDGGTLQELRGAAERRIVLAALERNGWHLTNTAKELGLADHASLSKVMKRHELKRPR